MKTQRGKQAHHPAFAACSYFGEAFVLRCSPVGQRTQAAAEFEQPAVVGQRGQQWARCTSNVDISCTQYAFGLCKRKNSFSLFTHKASLYKRSALIHICRHIVHCLSI